MEEKITAWIARDECGDLFLYIDCVPRKSELFKTWMFNPFKNSYVKQLKSESYPEIKWEDEKPTKVKLTIKICK